MTDKMTREDAKEVIEDIIIDVRRTTAEEDKALRMAIEALSVAELKSNFESAVHNCQKCAIKQLWEETEKEDLVEVVRCKDCRHQRFYINDKESFHCDKSGIVNMHIDDGDGDFFCKYGERKE